MYIDDQYYCGNILEHEIKAKGKYGKPGEKRGKRSKTTPEQIRKQNHWNRTKYIYRILNLNFEEHFATFITLTYRRDERPETIEELKKHKKKFMDGMRAEYKKHGVPFKWICRIEVGKKGGKHMHIIVNDIDGVDMKKLIAKHWPYGNPDIKDVYDLASNNLAEYFTKILDEVEGQISWMDDKDAVSALGCTCSRNLKKPEPQRHEYKRRTLEQAVRFGIKATKGYMVDEQSIKYGVNPFTGYTYLHYREIKCAGSTDRAKVFMTLCAPPWEVKC